MSQEFERVPKDLRDLRACLVCSLIKTHAMFYKYGCDNCEDILELSKNDERIEGCTSKNFEGMIALMDPKESWVAKWQRIGGYVKGMYAISVTGNLPRYYQKLVERNGHIYRSRDISLKTWTFFPQTNSSSQFSLLLIWTWNKLLWARKFVMQSKSFTWTFSQQKKKVAFLMITILHHEFYISVRFIFFSFDAQYTHH